MFLQGGPRRQAIMANRLQAAAKVPLLVAMDAEWGLDMRLDSSTHFAKQMTLGAMDDPKYVYQMGRDIARKMRALGVHVDFAPVLDVNSNPGNPVIGNRSFGENQHRVAALGIAVHQGLAGQPGDGRGQALPRPRRHRYRLARRPAGYQHRLGPPHGSGPGALPAVVRGRGDGRDCGPPLHAALRHDGRQNHHPLARAGDGLAEGQDGLQRAWCSPTRST